MKGYPKKGYLKNLGYVLCSMAIGIGMVALAAGIAAGLYKLYEYSPISAAIAFFIGFSLAIAAVVTINEEDA